MRADRIVIQPYDPAWPELFEIQRGRLEDALSPWLADPIEHIGSTSVPGLPAKPIIDMLALIDDYAAFAAALPALRDLSWTLAPEPNDEEHRKYSICYPNVAHRSHHLHVVEQASGDWQHWLLFRDYVRVHPDVAREYAALKQSLAAADADDRPKYRAAKAPFIQSVLADARRWDVATGRASSSKP